MDAGTFYGALAASAAAIYGVGGGFFAARIVGLAERVALVRREQADLQNSLVSEPSASTETGWRIRSRRNELADLYVLAGRIRSIASGLILSACLLVGVSCLALLEPAVDRAGVRIALLAGFVLSGAWWWFALWKSAESIRGVALPAFDERRKERDARKAEGLGYLFTGDPAQLHDPALVDQLADTFPSLRDTRQRRRGLGRWKRRLRRWKEPLV
jgi:hypothetical protein